MTKTKARSAAAVICAILTAALLFTMIPSTVSAAKHSVSKAEINKFFKGSAFIGSSTMIRKERYIKSKGKKFLGGPKFFTRKGYSFYNERHFDPIRSLKYKGKLMHAKNIIKKSKVKRIFIMMGTNDMKRGLHKTYRNYVRYLKGIRKLNPKVTIFIESMTSIYKHKPGSLLTPKNIRALNKMMKKYCESNPNMFYIDVFSGLTNKKGYMPLKYVTGERYAHVNRRGAAKWVKIDVKYVAKYLKYKKMGKLNVLDLKKHKSSKKNLKISKWDSSKKVLYFNDGSKVKGTAVFKRTFYAMSSKGKFLADKTSKIRSAAKKGKEATPLLSLLGKPLKTSKDPECAPSDKYGSIDHSMTYQYKHFHLFTYVYSNGKERIYGYESVY